MAENKELDLKANVPETVQVLKCFYNKPANKGRGNRYGYEVKVGDEVMALWGGDQMNDQIEPYIGKWVVIVKEEKKGESGGRYFLYKVNEAMFDNNGKEPKNRPSPEQVLKDEGFRSFRKNAMFLALEDASAVAEEFNKKHGGAFLLKAEDVRAIAISFAISFERKNGN